MRQRVELSSGHLGLMCASMCEPRQCMPRCFNCLHMQATGVLIALVAKAAGKAATKPTNVLTTSCGCAPGDLAADAKQQKPGAGGAAAAAAGEDSSGGNSARRRTESSAGAGPLASISAGGPPGPGAGGGSSSGSQVANSSHGASSRGAGSSVSIIVPALNEAGGIRETVRYLKALSPPPSEVIVVDGGSADATAWRAWRAGARVVRSGRGRGRQMNAGAQAAKGGWAGGWAGG